MKWPAVPLERIALDIQTGFARQPRNDGTTVPQLRTNNVSPEGRIDLALVKSVPAGKREVERYSLRPGDILFNNTNSPALVGKTALFDVEGRPYLFSNHMTRVRIDQEIAEPRFVARYMFWVWKTGGFRRMVTQWVNQAAINKRLLCRLEIPLPAKSEQNLIAEALEEADALLKKRTEADAKASRIMTALFLKAFGDPLTNPMGWPIIEMRRLFQMPPNYGTFVSPRADKGDWLDIRVANISNGKLDLSDRKYVDLPPAKIPRHEVREGDLLLTRAIGSLDHLGKCVVAYPGDKKWAFDSHLVRVRFDRTKAEPEYIRALLMTGGGRTLFLQNTRRSAVQFNINTKELARIKIPLPPLCRQKAFVQSLQQLRTIEDLQKAVGHKLSATFGILLHHAFSGDLTVEWREAHMKELVMQMEEQAEALNIHS